MLRTSPPATIAAHDDAPPPGPVDRILTAGRFLAIVGGLSLLIIHLIDVAFLDRRMLNANAEATVWTWTSVVAAFGVSLGAGLHALLVAARRTQYAVLAAGAAFLSMDDLTALHEAFANLIVRGTGISETWDSVLWPLLYLPLLGVVVLLLERLTRDAPARIRRYTLAGLALLVFAVALEVLSAPWSGQEVNWVHNIEGGIEEAAEQAGWTLLAVATIASAVRAMLRQARDS